MNSNIQLKGINDIYSLADKNNNIINVTIEVLTKCNWKCQHCYLPSHTSEGISTPKMFSLLKELRELGCFEIVFTGGEIFQRKDMIDIIKKARSLYFNIILFTNVSLLNEEKIKEISSLYISRISCTIFSLDEKIHDSITGIQGSLKRAMKNIMLIKKYNIPLEIKTILMKSNYNSYKDLKQFCDENGFIYKTDCNVFCKNDGNNEPYKFFLSDRQLKQIIEDTDKIIGYKSRERIKDEHMCPSIKHSIYIDSKGDIFPCNRLFIKLGNIYKDKIKYVWMNNEELKRIKEIKWKDLNYCIDCEKNNYCVRCPGITLLDEGDIFSKSKIACKIAEIRKEKYSYKNK